MIVGLDTGFLIRLLRGGPAARSVWDRIVGEEVTGAISCVTIYEIMKQGLRGTIAKEAAEALVEELEQICRVRWIDGPDLLRQAARVAHGNGLSMADTIILVSLMDAGAEEIYTTDTDFQLYEAAPRIVVM